MQHNKKTYHLKRQTTPLQHNTTKKQTTHNKTHAHQQHHTQEHKQKTEKIQQASNTHKNNCALRRWHGVTKSQFSLSRFLALSNVSAFDELDSRDGTLCRGKHKTSYLETKHTTHHKKNKKIERQQNKHTSNNKDNIKQKKRKTRHTDKHENTHAHTKT